MVGWCTILLRGFPDGNFAQGFLWPGVPIPVMPCEASHVFIEIRQESTEQNGMEVEIHAGSRSFWVQGWVAGCWVMK